MQPRRGASLGCSEGQAAKFDEIRKPARVFQEFANWGVLGIIVIVFAFVAFSHITQAELESSIATSGCNVAKKTSPRKQQLKRQKIQKKKAPSIRPSQPSSQKGTENFRERKTVKDKEKLDDRKTVTSSVSDPRVDPGNISSGSPSSPKLDWSEFLIRLKTPGEAWSIAGGIAEVAALTLMLLALWRWPIRALLKIRRAHVLSMSSGADSFTAQEIRRELLHYIPPDCTMLDPAGSEDMRQIFPFRTQPVLRTLDDAFSDSQREKHILILADSGMGKTSLLVNYYARNARRWLRQKRLVIIPLGRPDVLVRIGAVAEKRETIVMLDAFDEDALAIRDHRSRLNEIMNACADFRRVVITCRTQFFSSDEEIPKETGVAIVTPRKAGEGGTFKLFKIYLAPFTQRQVRRYLASRFPLWQFLRRRRAREIVRSIPELSARPMLLTVVPDLVAQRDTRRDLFGLYEFMVTSWSERESRWIDKDTLLRFSKLLAVNIYLQRERRQSERILKSELSEIAAHARVPPVDRWKLTARSLLNRDAEGNLKFAHRTASTTSQWPRNPAK